MRNRPEPTSFAEADEEEEQFDDDSGEDWKPEKVVYTFDIYMMYDWWFFYSNIDVERGKGRCETKIHGQASCCQETEKRRVWRRRGKWSM